jgi:hypothetical protein
MSVYNHLYFMAINFSSYTKQKQRKHGNETKNKADSDSHAITWRLDLPAPACLFIDNNYHCTCWAIIRAEYSSFCCWFKYYLLDKFSWWKFGVHETNNKLVHVRRTPESTLNNPQHPMTCIISWLRRTPESTLNNPQHPMTCIMSWLNKKSLGNNNWRILKA